MSLTTKPQLTCGHQVYTREAEAAERDCRGCDREPRTHRPPPRNHYLERGRARLRLMLDEGSTDARTARQLSDLAAALGMEEG